MSCQGVRVNLTCRRLDLFLFLVLVAGACMGGCSKGSMRKWRRYSAQENFSLALDAPNADHRREAIVRIAESRYVDSEDAFDTLDAVARTDPVVQNRCIAIRAFTEYRDDRPVSTLLKIWQAGPGSQQALPPNDDIRWETALALQTLERKGVLEDSQREMVRDLFIEMLTTGPTRNVRIVAAEALGSFQDRKVLTTLIAAVRNRDFAIADRAERSLIELTGTTNNYDADAWEKWLAETKEPFAGAGKPIASTQPAGPTWWDHQKRTWRRALKMGTED